MANRLQLDQLMLDANSLQAALRQMATRPRSQHETTAVQKADDRTWSITTSDPVVARRLLKWYAPVRQVGAALVFALPPKGCSFRAPRQAEQTEAARSRMQAVNSVLGRNGKAKRPSGPRAGAGAER